MNLRRITLICMLVALGGCAVVGMMAAMFKGTGDAVGGVFAIAITIALAAGAIFPLTMLVDRPKFRAGGFAAILLVVVEAMGICTLIAIDFWRWGAMRQLEDALAGSMGLLALYGIPTVAGLLLTRFRWVWWSAWFLVGVTILSLMVAGSSVVAEFFNGSMYRYSRVANNLVGSSVTTFGFGLLGAILLINVGCGDRRYFRWPVLTLGVCVWGGLVFMIWNPEIERDGAAKLLAGATVPVVFCALLNLLLMAPPKGAAVWLRVAVIAAALACGAVTELGIVTGNDEVFGSLGMAAGILTLCGSLALIVVALLQRRFDYKEEKLSEQLTHIEIKCPRCEKGQRVGLGNSVCEGCGLWFVIKAIEPRCAECGYLLYGIKSGRCPECGAEMAGVKGEPGGEAGGAQVQPVVEGA